MISFFLPIPLVPKSRTRVDPKRRGQRRFITPDRQRANMAAIVGLAMPHRPKTPIPAGVPVRLKIVVLSPVAKKQRASLDGDWGWQWRTAVPDAENLAGQIMDALTKARFWDDDRQVVDLRIVKLTTMMTGVWVIVEELEADRGDLWEFLQIFGIRASHLGKVLKVQTERVGEQCKSKIRSLADSGVSSLRSETNRDR